MFWNEERYTSSLIKITLIVLYTYLVFANTRYPNNQHILMWTKPYHFRHPFIRKGNKSFVINQCRHQNCFITYKHTNVAKNLTHYDAILFNAVTLWKKPSMLIPRRRAKHQKYILVSGNSAASFPLTYKYNNYFHWTWTYKLNSDISNAYIAIKDKYGKVIGPKQIMNWMSINEMGETKTTIIRKLQFKTTAAAWIITNCNQKSQYKHYIEKFRTELRNLNHTLDIYGACGNKQCPWDNILKCQKLLEKEYYFYLSFEDSMAEDYVTDQLLKALNNFAVPLVYGGANYTRFMPEGIYLNALELGPTKLAKEINDIIKNRKAYYDMFKWHNHYSFYNPYDNPTTNGICELCNLLNNKKRRAEKKVYVNIVTWFNDRKHWNPEDERQKTEMQPIRNTKHLNYSDKHLSRKVRKQNNKITSIRTNNFDQTFGKKSQAKESQDTEINLTTEILSIEDILNDKGQNYLLDRSKLKTSDEVVKYNNSNNDDFAEVVQMQNIIKNDLYNDIGQPPLLLESLDLGNETEKETTVRDNNEQNDNIEYNVKKQSLLELFKHLGKEDLATKRVNNIQSFDYRRLFDVESTTNKQEQTGNEILIHETTTAEQNYKNIDEQLKKENEILKNTLYRLGKMIMLNMQQLSTQNISHKSETKIPSFNASIYDKNIKEISDKNQIDTTDNNIDNNQKQKLDFDFKNSLKDIIKRAEVNITNISKKSGTAQINDNDNQKAFSTKINTQKNQNYEENKSGLRNVLIWTSSQDCIFDPTKMGKTLFTENKCKYQNCILSNKYSNITDVTKYEAVIFNATILREQPHIELPQQRDEHQKYILVSLDSAANNPITTKYNNFFNWTWTYKLDSDINFSYIVIKNKVGKIVGPAKDMHWIPLREMKETNKQILRKLQNKTTAVAWIMPDCKTINKYENYIANFRNELRKYNHVLNIFGQCGNMKCPNDDLKECYTLLEREYYFYLSFEDSIAEDYVTDQLLTALNHFVVPLVFGGANYTRFMPDEIYLDALELGPANLASKISDLIRNRKSYNDMFRWHNYYSYHNPLDEPNTSGICAFCALLNDEKRRNETTVYKNIVKWFNDRKDWNIEQERSINVLDERRYSLNTSKIDNKTNNYTTTMALSRSTEKIHNNNDDVVSVYNSPTDRAMTSSIDFNVTKHGLLVTRKKNHRKKSERLGEIVDYINYKEREKVKVADTPIECPDIVTCFSTILSNIHNKIVSFITE